MVVLDVQILMRRVTIVYTPTLTPASAGKVVFANVLCSAACATARAVHKQEVELFNVMSLSGSQLIRSVKIVVQQASTHIFLSGTVFLQTNYWTFFTFSVSAKPNFQ